MTADRASGSARPGHLAPSSEERERDAPSPEGPRPGELRFLYREDEVSLIDLWLVLARHRSILVSTVLACILAGLLFAFLRPQNYTFMTSIEIGTRLIGDEITPIESPQTVLAKLNSSYIPLARHEHKKNDPDDREIYEVMATVPRNSDLILLQSRGSDKEESDFIAIHHKVVGSLREDHSRIFNLLRKELQDEISIGKNKLAEIQERNQLLQAKLERIDKTQSLLVGQIDGVRELIAASERQRARAIGEATDEARAMTLLMISNDLQQNRTRLALLEERAEIHLADKRDELTKRLEDNRRGQEDQRTRLETLQLQLANLHETRAVTPLMRSLLPVDLGRGVVVALAGVLGLILGVVAAFFAEFLARVREVRSAGPGVGLA